MKILFLGASSSLVFIWLVNLGENVISTMNKITVAYIYENNFEFLISYGYRYILKKDIIDLFPNRCINLHISYLPYNRGADPNFWSFIDNTPKGVTIHYIDEGIDTGDIIAQRKVYFDDNETLATSYQKLHLEIQDLFYKNWEFIINLEVERFPQKGKGTFHKTKDKDRYLLKDGWNTKINLLS